MLGMYVMYLAHWCRLYCEALGGLKTTSFCWKLIFSIVTCKFSFGPGERRAPELSLTATLTPPPPNKTASRQPLVEHILGVSVVASCNSMGISYSLWNIVVYFHWRINIVDRHICGLTFVEYMLVRWGYWPGTGSALCRALPVSSMAACPRTFAKD